jgi:methionyl-tRNA formyltransferase
MRVLFWGTPDFALPSFRALLGEGHEIVGVVTQPDRPAGRGRVLQPSLVKREALEERIPVLQPERARGEEFLAELARLEPDISVVVAYGQILRPEVLELPPLGSINVHASILPELRGAAPINWAIIRGYEETGVTIMQMSEGLDSGPILLQVTEPIEPDERASDLWARLSEIGAAALIETLALIEVGAVQPVEQDHDRATYAPRLTREDARIPWDRDAVTIDRLVRGLDQVPGAWTTWNGWELKLYRPLPVPGYEHDAEPGTVLEADASDPTQGLLVACGEGAIYLREVKPGGRRRMTSADWVRGRGARTGDRFI